jgi:hypothetical protein
LAGVKMVDDRDGHDVENCAGISVFVDSQFIVTPAFGVGGLNFPPLT